MYLDKYTRHINNYITAYELRQITYEEFIFLFKDVIREAFSDDMMTHESLEALSLVRRAVRIQKPTSSE